MAIESVPVAQVPPKATPPVPPVAQGNKKPTADSKAADKDGQEFRKLLNGLDANPDADHTAAADGAAPSKDTDPADGGVARKKLLNTGKVQAGTTNATGTDTASWMAAYLPPVPAPLATPVATAVASGTSDAIDVLHGAATTATLKADAAAAAGSVVAAALPDARGQSANLANYASVFEQIQSRLAGGTGKQAATGSGAKGLAAPLSATAATDTRADQLATIASGGVWVMPVTEAATVQAATDAATALKFTGGEAAQKRESLVADKLPEGGVGQNHFTPTLNFDSAVANIGAGQAAPEAAVADQVSYWISHGIQNAELTFDGADAQPVQVSISLSGNEAHVAFRTDQLETRDLLTGAASHLRDLLQSQGMVLSGLSVGSSGARDTNGRERQAPSQGRQNTARSAPEVAAVRPAARQGSADRAVDLFV